MNLWNYSYVTKTPHTANNFKIPNGLHFHFFDKKRMFSLVLHKDADVNPLALIAHCNKHGIFQGFSFMTTYNTT